jgi:hypothetical protein
MQKPVKKFPKMNFFFEIAVSFAKLPYLAVKLAWAGLKNANSTEAIRFIQLLIIKIYRVMQPFWLKNHLLIDVV